MTGWGPCIRIAPSRRGGPMATPADSRTGANTNATTPRDTRRIAQATAATHRTTARATPTRPITATASDRDTRTAIGPARAAARSLRQPHVDVADRGRVVDARLITVLDGQERFDRHGGAVGADASF